MEKYKKIIKNNKFKISAPTWNEESELSGEAYSVSQIFKNILNEFKRSMRPLLIIFQ